jgi:hypothetical protein
MIENRGFVLFQKARRVYTMRRLKGVSRGDEVPAPLR